MSVYLADFGLALDVATARDPAEADEVSGSPAYLSPEQIMGDELTPRVDIYAMGIVLYELRSGERPFPGVSGSQLLQKQLYDPPPALRQRQPDSPAGVEEVLQRGTAKDASQRYPDMLSLAQALRQALFPAIRSVILATSASSTSRVC